MAEAMARKMLAERGLSGIEVGSAGTATYQGTPASEGAYLIGLEHGLDLSGHQAQQLTPELVADADIVFGMSPHHVERVTMLGGDAKAHLLGAYAGRTGDEAQVEDPYGGDLEEYRRTHEQLAALLADALDRLMGETGPDARRRDD